MFHWLFPRAHCLRGHSADTGSSAIGFVMLFYLIVALNSTCVKYLSNIFNIIITAPEITIWYNINTIFQQLSLLALYCHCLLHLFSYVLQSVQVHRLSRYYVLWKACSQPLQTGKHFQQLIVGSVTFELLHLDYALLLLTPLTLQGTTLPCLQQKSLLGLPPNTSEVSTQNPVF